MTDRTPEPIKDLTELRAALQLAVGLELSTIPVYLTALYSIKDGTNTDAAQTIRSVVMEEMLHMTLAANVLNALGEKPSVKPVAFRGKQLKPVPEYSFTSPLISGIGEFVLRPLTPEAVDSFVRIEHPFHGAATLGEIQGAPDTYPTIEVDAKNVTMGHEASVSKVGEDKLFYLMSRGMNEDEANAMVVNGFIEPLVKELPMEYALELNRLIQIQLEGSIG